MIDIDSDNDDLDSFFINSTIKQSSPKQKKSRDITIDNSLIKAKQHKIINDINNTMTINQQSSINNTMLNNTFQSNALDVRMPKNNSDSMQQAKSKHMSVMIDNIFLFNTKFNIPNTEPCFYINENHNDKTKYHIPLSSNEIKELYYSYQIDHSSEFRPIDFYAFDHISLYHFASISILNNPSWINHIIANPKTILFMRNTHQYNNTTTTNKKQQQQQTKLIEKEESLVLFNESIILPNDKHKDNDTLSIFAEDFIEEQKKPINSKNKHYEKESLATIDESGQWFLVKKKGQMNLKPQNHNTKAINTFPEELKQKLQSEHLTNLKFKREQPQKQEKVNSENNFAQEFFAKMSQKLHQAKPPNTPHYIKAFGSNYLI